MTDALHNLNDAVAAYRAQKSDAPQAPAPKAKSPYGQKIYDLNMAWAERKKEIQASLAEEEAAYKADVQKWQDLHDRWERDNRPSNQGQGSRGPQRTEFPPEVKIAAALLVRQPGKKSVARAILGISDTGRLNALLREGEELLQAQELAQRDKKIDAADAAGTEEW